ncbi:MAG: hypothetical protein U0531_18005 [Dehalococcoidia bacterium]
MASRNQRPPAGSGGRARRLRPAPLGDQPEPTARSACRAPPQTLLALQTQAETFYFWTYVAPNFDCEQMRRTLLLAAVPEAQLSEATAVFGRLVGFQYTKMDQASPVGAFQVSANWKDGGSSCSSCSRAGAAPPGRRSPAMNAGQPITTWNLSASLGSPPPLPPDRLSRQGRTPVNHVR